MTGSTIAAIATPPGRGGIGIIRISGPKASYAATAILGTLPAPRYAHFSTFQAEDGTALDTGLSFYFPAPHSFTGEDVLELHGHGGPVILDLLLHRLLSLGIELARPGEFSERAFLNGKMDLAQAEAVADLIDAASQQAARAAVRSLQGEFSRLINQQVEKLTQLRVYVEAAMDFPEEEIDFLADGSIEAQLTQLLADLMQIQAATRQGALLRDGMKVVIAGRPNVGKSSLLNRLSGEDTAIVTPIAGTTRDVLRTQVQIDGLSVQFLDTAGLRHSDDPIEQEGIRRARLEMRQADQLLLVLDATHPPENVKQLLAEFFLDLADHITITLIYNKIDLLDDIVLPKESCSLPVIPLSAKTGTGIPSLTNHLKNTLGFTACGEDAFSARRRHVHALAIAKHHLENALQQLQVYRAGELLAEELRLTQNALAEITGQVLPDALLGKIFSNFCIGK